jgi:hypothetical protein
MSKIYVGVTAEYDVDGNVRPVLIKWEDGRTFSIDKVLDVRQAPSLKGGGLGMRYTCRIFGRQYYLFNELGRWYLEK